MSFATIICPGQRDWERERETLVCACLASSQWEVANFTVHLSQSFTVATCVSTDIPYFLIPSSCPCVLLEDCNLLVERNCKQVLTWICIYLMTTTQDISLEFNLRLIGCFIAPNSLIPAGWVEPRLHKVQAYSKLYWRSKYGQLSWW